MQQCWLSGCIGAIGPAGLVPRARSSCLRLGKSSSKALCRVSLERSVPKT